MFKCTLGERNSGKSIFIENQVKRIDPNALYVATLPELEMYQNIISRHQKRRPALWDCIELFKMRKEEILTYPFQKYRNVILDNLSYYILFQIYFNKDNFINKLDERSFSFINQIAMDSSTIFYFIDTPINQNKLKDKYEKNIVRHFFAQILDKAAVIDKFYNENMIYQITSEEAKNYLFSYKEEGKCQDHLLQNN